MNTYFFVLWSTKTNFQIPLQQICNWVKATQTPPWTNLVMQASDRTIATQLKCTSSTRNSLMDVIEAAISYANANYSAQTPDVITDLAAAYPNPLDPACLEFLVS